MHRLCIEAETGDSLAEDIQHLPRPGHTLYSVAALDCPPPRLALVSYSSVDRGERVEVDSLLPLLGPASLLVLVDGTSGWPLQCHSKARQRGQLGRPKPEREIRAAHLQLGLVWHRCHPYQRQQSREMDDEACACSCGMRSAVGVLQW